MTIMGYGVHKRRTATKPCHADSYQRHLRSNSFDQSGMDDTQSIVETLQERNTEYTNVALFSIMWKGINMQEYCFLGLLHLPCVPLQHSSLVDESCGTHMTHHPHEAQLEECCEQEDHPDHRTCKQPAPEHNRVRAADVGLLHSGARQEKTERYLHIAVKTFNSFNRLCE